MTDDPPQIERLASVGDLIVGAFMLSRSADAALAQDWVNLSARIGSKLQRSLLMVSIQRLGEVDQLCRALEAETVARPAQPNQMDFRFSYLHVLSEWWVGSAYAILFTLKERKIFSDPDFLYLANGLRMLRVQIEKHEIALDKKLAVPLRMSPSQLRDDELANPPIYTYDKSDPLRAHIARSGMSERGSIMWEVIDVTNDQALWLERLELSNRIIDIFKRGPM